MAEAENTKRAPEIKARPVESLTANPRNARKHTPAQVTQIVESIRAYGWTAPLIIDETGLVLAGHGRLLAAQELGLRKVPCVVKRGLTDRQKRAYLLADNKIAENSTWDRALLSVELAELVTGPVTGFSLREMASLIEPREAIEAAPAKPSVATAKSGDLYELGKHRVLCGDATNAADVKRVAPDGWDVAVLDPPFEMDKLHHLTDPSVVFYGSIRDVVQIPRELIRFERVIDKKKKHRIASTHLGLQHSYVIQVGSKKTCPQDRKTYPSVVAFEERSHHPHQKPVWLLIEHLTVWMAPWERVFDPFAGSGSTLIAAEQLGRSCLAIEKDPAMVDVIVKRWEHVTGHAVKLLTKKGLRGSVGRVRGAA